MKNKIIFTAVIIVVLLIVAGFLYLKKSSPAINVNETKIEDKKITEKSETKSEQPKKDSEQNITPRTAQDDQKYIPYLGNNVGKEIGLSIEYPDNWKASVDKSRNSIALETPNLSWKVVFNHLYGRNDMMDIDKGAKIYVYNLGPTNAKSIEEVLTGGHSFSTYKQNEESLNQNSKWTWYLIYPFDFKIDPTILYPWHKSSYGTFPEQGIVKGTLDSWEFYNLPLGPVDVAVDSRESLFIKDGYLINVVYYTDNNIRETDHETYPTFKKIVNSIKIVK